MESWKKLRDPGDVVVAATAIAARVENWAGLPDECYERCVHDTCRDCPLSTERILDLPLEVEQGELSLRLCIAPTRYMLL